MLGRLVHRRTTSGVIAATVALIASLVLAMPAGGEGLSPEVVAYSDTSYGDGDGLRTPDVISTSPTDLVVAWREGSTNGQYDNGSIKYSYSTDAGATWSAPSILAQKDATYGWHYVILYRVGTDLYAFLGREPATANGQPVTTFMKKSTDGGHTWQAFSADFSGVPASFVIAGRPLKYGAYHIAPIWKAGQVAVMRSTDLVTWTAGAFAPDPLDTKSGENQLVVSQDDPNKLVMFSRVSGDRNTYLTGAVYTSSTSSTDGGLTWSSLAFDQEIPNMGTKGYVTKDSAGRYLAIYNTDGGLFPSDLATRSPGFRSILNYKVKKPGQPWGPGRFFADGPKIVDRPHSAGWDTYPMADEYAPGKYFAVWESDTSAIKVVKLDISDAFTGVQEEWTALGAPWTTTTAGGTASISSGRLALSNANSTLTTVSQPTAPDEGFILNTNARITAGGAINTSTGVGANLAYEVSNGSRLLSVSLQSDGVYAKQSGSTAWSKVRNQAIDSSDHTYRVVVSAAGSARLYVDSVDTGVSWTIPTATTPKRTTVWTSGSAATPSTAQVDWTSVEENVLSTTWDNLTGWQILTNAGSTTISSGEIVVSSTNAGVNGAYQELSPFCDFSLDFRGQVTDYSTLNPSNGQGTSLALSASNSSRRLMLSLQQDGVYSIVKGETSWSRVYTLNNAGNLASWRVDTNSSGQAKLFRNGVDTGASWFIQDRSATGRIQVWTAGTSGDPAAAKVDWLRTTCNTR